MSNSNGEKIVISEQIARQNEMRHFDILPPILRERIRYTAINYSACQLYGLLASGFTLDQLLASIHAYETQRKETRL